MNDRLVTGYPWPAECFALDLDVLGPVTLDQLAQLEQRSVPSVGVIRGRCEGAALAAALAVDLLVAGPDASFGRPGPWVDIVVRRGVGLIGRKAVGYLAMTGRTVGAEVARRWGLVSYVDDRPAHAAVRLAGLVGGRSARAVATVLEQVHRGAGPAYTLSAPGPERPKARS